MMEAGGSHTQTAGDYFFGHNSYLTCKESFDVLLDLEEFGMR